MRQAFLATTFLAALPMCAQAQSEFSGYIALGYVDYDTISDAAAFTDFTWTYDFGGFGVELGSYGMWTQDIHPHETYASVYADVAGGRLSAGVPRPAYDRFAIAHVDDAFPLVGILTLPATRSFATTASAIDEEVPLGLSYTSDVGRSQYAVSVHNIDDLDTQIFSFGAAFDAGQWQVAGGMELIDAEGDSATNGKLQVATQIDQLDLSISYFANGYDDVPDLAEFAVAYHVTPSLKASAFVMETTQDSSNTLLGAAMDYAIGNNIEMKAGVAKADDETALAATVGWRF